MYVYKSLGEGIGLYFQFLKYFGQTFTIMALMAVPSMVCSKSAGNIGLFCRISSLLKGSFAKETYHFFDPTPLYGMQ